MTTINQITEQLKTVSAITITVNQWEKVLDDIAGLKAAAVRDAKMSYLACHTEGCKDYERGYDDALEQYDEYLENYANQIEGGK